MKIKILLIVFFVFLGCRVVNDDTTLGNSASFATPSQFQEIDSLLQNGSADAAIRALRQMPVNEITKNDILWRIVGAYNGRGRVADCIAALDSLERIGWGSLTGWKISVLDINRETDTAVELVASGDYLLLAWLYRDSLERMPSFVTLPVPGHLGERAARLLLAPEGITSAQLQLAASDVKYLPLSVGNRVAEELELTYTTSANWWLDALKSFDPSMQSDVFIRLQALNMKYQTLGDYNFWQNLIGTDSEHIAARVIASRWPEMADWQVIDVLVDAGYSSTASAISDSRGDPFFTLGVRMALLRNAGRYSDLETLCDSVPATSSRELLARAALFKARSFRARRQNTTAYRAYYRFAQNYPFHRVAREAAYLAGKYFDSEQNWAEAADAYLASLNSSGAWDGDARGHWRGGFCLYMNGRGSIADSLWEAGCVQFPYSHWVDEMLFWRARYAARQGNESLSNQLLSRVAEDFPWEFYGMLAAERLGIQDNLTLSVVSPVFSENPLLTKAANLFSLGYGSVATEMLFSGSVGDKGINAIALALLGEHGKSIASLRALDTEYRETNQGILPDSLLGWYFPEPYTELVASVTDTMTLDASYVEGIMREESYFNRFVISSAGAAGLIQLMPGTAGDVARWNGLPRLSPEEFFNPEHSVLYGSLYINSQARRYDHPALFLAAYNAGPGNASRWIDMHGFTAHDQELYIEQITYRETRMYAKKVQRSAWIYGRIR